MPKKLPIAETPTPGRICWLCTHVYFCPAEGSYSEYTPGSDFVLNCTKGYWEISPYRDELDDFRQKLESAERCLAFEERPRK